MIRMILFIVSTSFCCVELIAQDDNLDKELYSQDTVFILLSKKNRARVNGTNSIKPHKKYPEDMSRRYVFSHDYLAFNTYFTRPDLKKFYFLEEKEKFLDREYITDQWFQDKTEVELSSLLENKVLMLVDHTFEKKNVIM